MIEISKAPQTETREVWDISEYKRGIIKKITVIGKFNRMLGKVYWETIRGRHVTLDSELADAYTDHDQALKEAIKRAAVDLVLTERKHNKQAKLLKVLKAKQSVEAQMDALIDDIKSK